MGPLREYSHLSVLMLRAVRSVPTSVRMLTFRRGFAVQATAPDGYDSRSHEFFIPTDSVQRIFFERMEELGAEIDIALAKPYVRTPQEVQEVEILLKAEREKLGLTDAAFDVPVSKEVRGTIANLRQYIQSQN
eukprot:c2229_g1_i1.p1 GENE.c2229_g1_i1~~c2229_g1_i1.p1  ORF type:complete len:133 (+),score=20.34 c2229_g1_i1:1-399(+)